MVGRSGGVVALGVGGAEAVGFALLGHLDNALKGSCRRIDFTAGRGSVGSGRTGDRPLVVGQASSEGCGRQPDARDRKLGVHALAARCNRQIRRQRSQMSERAQFGSNMEQKNWQNRYVLPELVTWGVVKDAVPPPLVAGVVCRESRLGHGSQPRERWGLDHGHGGLAGRCGQRPNASARTPYMRPGPCSPTQISLPRGQATCPGRG